MMMGGKGTGAGPAFPLQSFYSDTNDTATGRALQITGIDAADRVANLVWFFVVGWDNGTAPLLNLTGETLRYSSGFAGDSLRVFTYVTSGTEGNSVTTTTSDLEYADIGLYVLDPSLSGYFSGATSDESGPGSDSILFADMAVNSTSDLALAFMCNNDGSTYLNGTAVGWDQFERPEGGGGIGGITGSWLYYLYYKDGGHGSTTVSLSEGEFTWDKTTSYESQLFGFERV